MAYIASNNASTTLAASITNVATTLTIPSGDASKFPTINNGGVGSDYTLLTLQNAAGTIEIVRVTRHDASSTSFTVVRAQEGTAGVAWSSGDVVSLRLTAQVVTDSFAHPGQSSGAHAATAISFSPTGGIAATTVQAAIAEVDSEKAPLNGTGASGTWPISISGNAATATNAGRAYPNRSDGAAINFVWSGTGGQPGWVWGGDDGTNMYVYNPSNFSVNYAASAGSCTGNAATATKLSNDTGSAPSYSCRAWVNFNGTGTIATKASGNVSSMTDNGVGDYTINFSTSLPDANYAGSYFTSAFGDTGQTLYVVAYKNQGTNESPPLTKTTSAARIHVGQGYGAAFHDVPDVSVCFFR